MAIARDWLKTLWRTSYKGAAFWVETDTEGGGRRIVIHEFPMRDEPFLEDLGERYREFTVTAYVASDRADTEAAALMAICAQRGPGVLILPTQGGVLVRCLEFSRRHEKDRLGYIAHELRFVRQGASGALASVASLINMIFVQAEAITSTVANLFATAASLANVPDYVASAFQNGTENALATMEAVRTTKVVDVAVSAEQRDAIQSAYNVLPEAIAAADTATVTSVGETVIKAALALVENMEAAEALSTFEEIIADTPIVVQPTKWMASKWVPHVEQNEQAALTLLRIAALLAYCEAIARLQLTDRQSAITLRGNVSRYFDEQIEALPSESYELFHAMTKMRDTTVDYLSRAVIDLAPVIRIQANAEMPSLYWAWRLYADPNRSTEIVERNRLANPSFIPTSFEALRR